MAGNPGQNAELVGFVGQNTPPHFTLESAAAKLASVLRESP